jgi:hypothetical protein
MWRIWWAPNNASEGQMGFNLVFKGLMFSQIYTYALQIVFYLGFYTGAIYTFLCAMCMCVCVCVCVCDLPVLSALLSLPL